MGRPPSNGGPSFRFTQAEIAEMEAILQAHKTAMPERQILVCLAEKFSNTAERLGKTEVQMKQVWNWFQNRRYVIRAKAAKASGKPNVTQGAGADAAMVKGVPQATQPHAASSVNVRSLPQAPQRPIVPSASVRTLPQAPQNPAAFSVQTAGRVVDNSQMEYEAKSARDGAWYDVSTFLSHRSLETSDPEVLVRFVGFGAEEDEWINVRRNVRPRSLPCESSECVAVLPADLILCFQEGKEQALYFDAHVLDAQRRRHDVRGCRCRFLVRYDHDQSEEIVPLRKICRRPETDYRLQQLHAVNGSILANHNRNTANNNNSHTVSTLRVYPPAEVQPKQHKAEPTVPPEAPQKRQRLDSVLPQEGSEKQHKVEPAVITDVPQNQPTVQAALPASSAQPSVEPLKVEPMVPSSSDQASVESKKVEAVVSVPPIAPIEEPIENKTDSNVVEEPIENKTDSNVVEEPIENKTDSNVVLETKSLKSMVPVSTNILDVGEGMESRIEDHVVSVSSNDPNVVQPAKTEEPVLPVFSINPNAVQEAIEAEDSNVVHETKAEEPVVPVSCNDPNVVQETRTEEPVTPGFSGDSNVVQEAIQAQTEEPVMDVSTDDSNVVQETKTEELVVPVSTNFTNAI